MFTKKLLFSLGFAFTIALLLTGAFTNVALADDEIPPKPTPTPVVIRQGEPVTHSEPAVPVDDSVPASAVTLLRGGWTDAWYEWYYPLTYVHNGSHNSESDLVEDQIWADGNLKKTGGAAIASCSNHTSGQYAHCPTSKTYYVMYAVTATSWHFFHKSGWVDQNFSTSKSISP